MKKKKTHKTNVMRFIHSYSFRAKDPDTPKTRWASGFLAYGVIIVPSGNLLCVHSCGLYTTGY